MSRPHTQPASPSLSRSARLTLTVALLLALMACALSSIACLALWQARAHLVSGADVLLAYLDDLCTPGAPPWRLPIQQSLHVQGHATLTGALTVPVKDHLSLPPGLTVPFKGNIPIKTTLQMQLFRSGPAIDVPINMIVPVATQVTLPHSVMIPIDIRVSVPAGLTMPMEADVSIHQDVPLEVCPPAGPMRQVIETTKRQVRAARDLASPAAFWQYVLQSATD